MPHSPPVVCLLGPTASGKTGLAVELVKRFPFDIISVDSAMVYRGMDIGTAKPGADILAQAPHRLIDFLDPAVAYSAAAFRDDALREIEQVYSAGRVPLLVGGTMMYFKALLHGLAELPSADEDTRLAIFNEAQQLGWAAMHTQLAEVDPASAQRIHPNDPQRIQRALEVYRLTGTRLSEWQARPVSEFPWQVRSIGLIPSERAWLHQRIEQRFQLMLEQGFEKEVKDLYQRGDLSESLPSIRAVGYRQMWSYLRGEWPRQQMIERALSATRQLAKRQLTWLRALPGIETFDCVNKDLTTKVLNLCKTIPMKL